MEHYFFWFSPNIFSIFEFVDNIIFYSLAHEDLLQNYQIKFFTNATLFVMVYLRFIS